VHRLLHGRRGCRRGRRRQIDEVHRSPRTATAAARTKAVVAAAEHHFHSEADDQQQNR